ncbi:ABC transporter ATP-binding protein [Variovorax ginsengisoli]|jgi:branched-chain amino acid transport system ATP-binding protein|uniref:ABC transporter ATP-binding protein n=2 Tax=Comamonadaceae TaxID=80864 RepID=A0ABT8SBW3_9BURK|nr:ABC transporter ATP-binding protein [Variovorax ginsengisoli]MDN8617115.1 ABC transporter ATP-binding protein [Variovorax ginsengisoli]MDO1536285.1 ABC transporter ATP-binding protein [Variovorax ginsengisoli]
MTEAMLKLESLKAGYGPTTVLDGLSLAVAPGERVAMVGRNGVGKTTTLRAIMGLVPLAGGRIEFLGEDISRLSPHQRARRGLGYVPQTRDIFPSLTVEENLLAGLKHRPRSAVDEAYALFPRLAERRRNGGTQLSGGEQQMLSVARALLGRPRLILLDEPLEGLAPLIRQELLNAFQAMSRETGIAVVIVEQQVDEALRYARRALVLDHGTVVHESDAQVLLRDTETLDRWVGMAVH